MRISMAPKRRRAESLMLDRCVIVELGDPVTDADGDVSTPETPVYGTAEDPRRCKVQAWEAQEANPEAGGATLTVQRYQVHIPVGSMRPAVGQVVEITVAALDPNLTGCRFRVVALLHKTLATAYRLGVEEVL